MKTIFLFLNLTLIFITTAVCQNHPPVAVNDTVYGFYNYPVQVNLLKNDYDPDGDSIFIKSLPPYLIKLNDSTWQYTATGHSVDYSLSIKLRYSIKDKYGSTAIAYVVLVFKSPIRFDSLDINNINALISPFGQHFWDLEKACFEVPKGSGKHAVFTHSFWTGGIDPNGQLHCAAERYRHTQTNTIGIACDFSQGPISSVVDSSFDKKWNRVWKVNKQEIRHHIASFTTAGYQPIDAIINWPAHGDVSLGQSANIAPFYDNDNNHIYNPSMGDYPLIRGDEAIFFVFNDSAYIHTESFSPKVGIEIHGMAYAFDEPTDSLLCNTIFLHYDIINKSLVDYHDFYLGLFSDMDLGNSADDFFGSDVKNGMIYTYNGDSFDENYTTYPNYFMVGYGMHPPAMGLKVIGGPYLPADGIDNPANGCDYSINGLNFGDNIVDNERMGMTYSNDYRLYNPMIKSASPFAGDFYRSMQNIMHDGTHIIYGGNGKADEGGVGPDCNFMFPGNSDECNWGTNGVLPNGGYNQNGKYWTEGEAKIAAGDRNGVASIGPFTLYAGQSIPLDYCFTFARAYSGDSLASVELLRERISAITPQLTELIKLPETYYSIDEKPKPSKIHIRPNPATDWIIISSEEKLGQPYQIFDFTGKLISAGTLLEGSNQINIQKLKPGVYLMKSGYASGRFVKM